MPNGSTDFKKIMLSVPLNASLVTLSDILASGFWGHIGNLSHLAWSNPN